MSAKEKIHIFCGDGRGKTCAAIGSGIKAAGSGRSVTVIQFLKGKDKGEYELLRRLEPDIKLFSFEKSRESYKDLGEADRGAQVQNIMNGFNFARKVLATGECDLLILDEFLGLVDTGIVSDEAIIELINSKPDATEMILTGINVSPEICSRADDVTIFSTRSADQIRAEDISFKTVT